jgi:hypothetical protein
VAGCGAPHMIEVANNGDSLTMSYVLTARERKLLDHMKFDHRAFQIPGEMPVGVSGKVTLTRLVELGLLETGRGRFYQVGYRITDDGWRCIYGKTYEEIMSSETPSHPLKVWSWPPTPDNIGKMPRDKLHLSTLPPRLKKIN